ncbi:cupin domain-containing protein [soil metagenome]
MKLQTTALLIVLTFAGTPTMAADEPKLPHQEGSGHLMVNADALEWKDVPSMAEGAKIAVIEGDLSKEEPFTFRLKLPQNYKIAPHTHPAVERVTVLSGTLHFARGEEFDQQKAMPLRQGSVAIMPPGDPMYGFTTTEETIIQIHGTGPWGIDYINPEDDPRN